MDTLSALIPNPPFDDTTGPVPIFPTPSVHVTPPPPDAPPPDAAERADLIAALEDLRLQCHQLARRRHELAFQIVGHNEIAALNALLLRVVPYNAALWPRYRSARVAGWGKTPIPGNCLLAPADLIPDLSAALAVLAKPLPDRG